MEKLLKEIENPESIYRGAPFWAWNGKLNEEELRWQIDIMKKMGLGGFFMHSRFGLKTKYLSKEWFNLVNVCCEQAEKNKMYAWLYDEDRWPSGAAGGIVTKDKRYRMRHLAMINTDDTKKIKWRKNTVAIFICEFEGERIKKYRKIGKNEKIKNLKENERILIFNVEIEKSSSWFNGYTYLDTLNLNAVKKFIEVTYERYKKYCGKYFGNIIPGIFTDEPHYGNQFIKTAEGILVSWTDKFPEIFKEKYGYDICEHLPEIYYDIVDKEISKARYHYRELLTELFVTSFAKQIGDWCEKNNLLFTGHILCEDTLSSQTSVVGNCMRFYQYMQAPGMDLLTEHWRLFNTAKQVSSVARQFDRKFRLTETYGCTGWDFPFLGHKMLGDWQAALGINLRCQHLSWYTMEGESKRDYPASIFYQSPWYDAYKVVEDYFARLNLLMTKEKEVRDLLIIHPVESMWCIYKMDRDKDEKVKNLDREFTKMCDIFLSNHIDFDYGDEEIMGKYSKIEEKDKQVILKVNKAEYKAVFVSSLLTIRSSTLKILNDFKEKGGKVVFMEPVACFVDGEKSEKAKELSKKCILVKSYEEAIKELEICRRVSIKEENGKEAETVLYLLREDEEFFYLFICNANMEWKENVLDRNLLCIERKKKYDNLIINGFPSWKYKPYEIDLLSGKIYETETIQESDGYSIKTSLSESGARFFLIPKKEVEITSDKREKIEEIKREEINIEKFEIKLNEPNVLVLDMAYYKMGDENWSENKEEVLKIDDIVREKIGLEKIRAHMVQPWAQKIKKVKPLKVYLKYTFNVEKIPNGEIKLAIENPSLYEISVNGNKIEMVDSGWWVDKSLRLIRFNPSILKLGENEILLETSYNEKHSGFEIIYLLGNFGVKREEKEFVITQIPEFLKIGDWTEQGLYFYSGNVTYFFNLNVKKESRISLNIPEYRGAGLRIYVNGNKVGVIPWPPNQIEITDFLNEGENLIGIEILGHRRNSHGPFHIKEKWPVWTGPGEYRPDNERWYEGYQIVPVGLFKNPEIIYFKYKLLQVEKP